MKILSQQVTGTSISCSYWNADTPTDDQFSQLTSNVASWPIFSDEIGVAVRVQIVSSIKTYYYFTRTLSTTCKLYKKVNNVNTTLATVTQDYVPGEVMRIECYGSKIRAYLNGTMVASVVDAGIPSGGYLGITGTYANVKGDDWSGGNVAPSEYLIEAGVGDFAFTGSAAALKLGGASFVAAPASYPFTGVPARLSRVIPPFLAGVGDFSFSGTAASLRLAGASFVAGEGNLPFTGSQARLFASYAPFLAGVGDFTFAGIAATLRMAGAKFIAGEGAFSMGGTAAEITYQWFKGYSTATYQFEKQKRKLT